MRNRNYYQILEILPSASQNEIHQAYRRAKSTYSKGSSAIYSLYGEEELDEIISSIDKAYSVLSNRELREKYDKENGFNEGAVKGEETYRTAYSMVISEDEDSEEPGIIGFSDAPTSISVGRIRNDDRDEGCENRVELRSEKATGQDGDDRSVNTNKQNIDRGNDILIKPEFEKDDKFEEKISQEKNFTGEFLKKVREYKNMSVEFVAKRTKIGKSYIRAIEADNYSELPKKVFLRGFLINYARELDLDPEIVVKAYLSRLNDLKP